VPIVIAATGPRMIRTAGRIADGVILHHGVSPDLVGRALGWLDGAPVEVSCWTAYSLGADATEARNRTSRPCRRSANEREAGMVHR